MEGRKSKLRLAAAARVVVRPDVVGWAVKQLLVEWSAPALSRCPTVARKMQPLGLQDELYYDAFSFNR